MKREPGSGFSLVEVLVSTAISLSATLIACQLAVGAQVNWRAANARVDLQQRARVVSDMLGRMLREAGGGPQAGAASGPLGRFVPPVLPRRLGTRGAHAPDVFRRDVFSVVSAVAETSHARLLTAAAASASVLELAPGAGCAVPSCGLSVNSAVMLLSAAGVSDLYTVASIDGAVLTVRPRTASSGAVYPAGTPLIAISLSSLSLDAATATLREYDGDSSDLPVQDDVVAMDVRYFGDVRGPVWPRPSPGESNCLYAADGTYHAALVPALSGIAGALELSAGDLTDGPWCGSGGMRFDADLLRVRRVRITLRLQAGDPAVRGTDRSRFANPGLGRDEKLLVPDVVVSIDVALRNVAE